MNDMLKVLDQFVTPVGDDVLHIATNHTGVARVIKRDSKRRTTMLMSVRPDQSGTDATGFVIQAKVRTSLSGSADLADVISAICTWGVRRDVLIDHMAGRAVRRKLLVDLVQTLPADRDALLIAARAALLRGSYYYLGQDLTDGMARSACPATYLQGVAFAQSRAALDVSDAVAA